MAKSKKILQEIVEVMRASHYSIHTERAYRDWIRRYIKFHGMTCREDLADGERKVEAFLTHLAVEGNVAAATQNQALNALVFLYKRVLKTPLGDGIDAVRARRKRKIPVVLTPEEARRVLVLMTGVPQLVAKLLYGSGLRVTEAVRLRVKDIDLDMKEITVHEGKGSKDRVTTLSASVIPFLTQQMSAAKLLHEQDLEDGFGEVYLPHALDRKYKNAGREWIWQYVFPAACRSVDPRSGVTRRHHVDPSVINRAIRSATKKSGVLKHVTAHTFRHSFATHLLQRGTDIRTVQALLGHDSVTTTMIYTHVLKQGGNAVISPLDDLGL